MRDLRLRWLWSLESGGQVLGRQRASLQWNEPASFYGSNNHHNWKWRENIFLNNAWIQGLHPKELAPSVYTISKKKNRML
jgi:hypothetical protein